MSLAAVEEVEGATDDEVPVTTADEALVAISLSFSFSLTRVVCMP